MTDIIDELRALANIIGATHPMETASMLRNAAEQIQSYRSNLANIPSARFDRFFVAALQGLMTDAEWGGNVAGPVRRAYDAACLAVKYSPPQVEEDS